FHVTGVQTCALPIFADEAPEFLRLRKAVQYAESLDDFVAIMEQDNNGGYANSWLLGDQKSGEIMRFELGLKFSSVDRTDNGYFRAEERRVGQEGTCR